MAKGTRSRSLEAVYPDSQPPPSASYRPQASSRRVLVGFVLALVAFTVAFLGLKRNSQTQLVVSVKAPVAAGSVISGSDLGEASIPVGASVPAIPSGQRGSVIGQVAQIPLYPGDILDPHDAGTQPALPPGDVAMTLSLAPEQAVGGTLRAGDSVDVFAAPTTVAPGASPAAAEVLSGVAVRGVATPSTQAGLPAVYVTLVLTPGQATTLDAAYRAYKVDLALANR